MPSCCICTKMVERESGMLFNVPKEVKKRKKWSEICKKELSATDRICDEHFSSSDIRKSARRVQLKPNAVPLAPSDNCNNQNKTKKKSCLEMGTSQDSVAPISMEYDDIKLTSEKAQQECRCCTNPSGNFTQLDECIQTSEGMEKSYKNLLYGITEVNISTHYDSMMPQQVCQKCAFQIKNIHKFIQQVSEVAEQYIKKVQNQYNQEDVKNIELLPETTAVTVDKLKNEPLDVEEEIEIKEEELESEMYIPTIVINEKLQEERDSLQITTTDKHSPEDNEQESDESESVKSFSADLKEASLAMSCDICHNVYRNAQALKIHKRYTHLSEEEKLPCPLCSYRANCNSALKTHIGLVHGQDKVNDYFKPTPEQKKYPCNLCSRSYEHKDSLRKHVKEKHLNNKPETETVKTPKHKDKKPFLCTYCGQSYGSKWYLDHHTLSHTGERPFPCETCSKTFKRLSDLRLHQVTHSDEKPHQCSECGKGFKRVDKLKIHMRVHSELRPYKCTECEKTFKYPNVLKTHMQMHTGEASFARKNCAETYGLMSFM